MISISGRCSLYLNKRPESGSGFISASCQKATSRPQRKRPITAPPDGTFVSGSFVARSEPFTVPFIPVMPGLVGDDFEVARGAPTTMLDHILFL
jgi:hypothetical protein